MGRHKQLLGSISFTQSPCHLIVAYTWVSVLQPRSSNFRILFVDDMFDILCILLNLVCHLNAGQAGSDSEYLQFPGRRILAPNQSKCDAYECGNDYIVNDIRNVVAA
jgi:hypothetical protein